MTCLGTASLWVKIAFICLVVALILDICGFAIPSWMVYQITTLSIRVGLWQIKSCSGTTCYTNSITSTGLDTNDEFKATQAMEIIALVLFIVAPIAAGVYVFAAATRNKCFAYTCLAICLSAAFFILIGMACWLVYVPSPYVSSYALGLTVLAGILAFIAGLLFIPDILDKDYYDDYY